MGLVFRSGPPASSEKAQRTLCGGGGVGGRNQRHPSSAFARIGRVVAAVHGTIAVRRRDAPEFFDRGRKNVVVGNARSGASWRVHTARYALRSALCERAIRVAYRA
jgi:hypothetical protein